MINLYNKRVLVTGSRSMIGRATRATLHYRGAVICSCDHSYLDLMDFERTKHFFEQSKPDYIIHLATYSGNIQFNQKYPADTFYRTTQIGLNVLTAAQQLGVKKVVSILSSCAIADCGKEELEEDDLWKGKPNPSIECHGFAKRNLDAYSRQISRQFGLDYVTCIVNNSYGPNDSFDPVKTKVIGSLIKRFVDAKDQDLKEVECWGTGTPLREFIYCYDAGEGIVQVLEKYDDSRSPINITSGIEVSIKNLTELIAKIVGYTGQIKWDTSKSDGQMRKRLSMTKMREYIEFKPTSLEDGLKATIKWYRENKC